MSSIPEDELEALVSNIVDILDYDGPSKKSEDEIKKAIRQYAAKERLDERKQVALDNYHGHTFSDETNYKYKFDKFIASNERRIKQLKEGSKWSHHA